ncbi:MAG: hypothetical protein GY765_07100 [bacterium]|nr:hypothetical protein [bacterium]
MFAGHLGVGLALKKAEKGSNLGWLFFASLFPDFLLGILVLSGMESIHITADFAQLHYPLFSFPYSHGLIAVLCWSALFFLVVKFFSRDKAGSTKKGLILGACVFLHYMADVIVHVAEMPLLGNNSPKIGLGLWNHLYLGLAFEMLLVVIGLVLYLKSTKTKGALGSYGIPVLMVLISVFTIVGMTVAPPPPNPQAPATFFVIQTFAIAALGFWLDKKRS